MAAIGAALAVGWAAWGAPPDDAAQEPAARAAPGSGERSAAAPAGEPAGGEGSWFRFQGDARATGLSPRPGPGAARVAWSVPAGGWCSSAALDARGRIYVFMGHKGLVCLGPDGERLWSFRTPPAPPPPGLPPAERNEWATAGVGGAMASFAPLVGSDGTVYFGTTFHPNPTPPGAQVGLHAVRPDGTERWFVPTARSVTGSPNLGADGNVYLTTADAVLAVTPDGRVAWTHPRDGAQVKWSSPAVAPDGTVYAVDGRLLALTPAGRLSWAWAPRGGPLKGFAGHPTVGADGTVYVAVGRSLHAVGPRGEERWTREIGTSESSPALGPDGSLYIGALPPGRDRGGALLALDPRDGRQKWAFDVETYIDSSPAVGSDGTVYFGSDDGYVYAVSASGALVWKLDVGRSARAPSEVDASPALGRNGVLYVGHSGGPVTPGGFRFYAIGD